jgi:phospholipase/carboxylesterase
MEPLSAKIESLSAIEVETAPNPSASVIWLHGLGADGHDFEPVVPELELDGLAIRFVFPHAPTMPVTINGGMVMRAWYDITDSQIRREDERGVRASQALVEALIAKEAGRGIPASRVVLAGFSQGGAIALHTAVRRAEPLAGIMALSTYLPLADMAAAEAHAASKRVPIFMGHGISDQVIPLPRAVSSRDALIALGYQVEWHQYPMPHSVSPQEISDIAAWLRGVLGPART